MLDNSWPGTGSGFIVEQDFYRPRSSAYIPRIAELMGQANPVRCHTLAEWHNNVVSLNKSVNSPILAPRAKIPSAANIKAMLRCPANV